MLEKIQEIMAEQLGIEAGAITPEKSFKEDLNIDSLDLFELVTSLEDHYSIEISTEDLEQLTTVQNVMDYLKTKGVED